MAVLLAAALLCAAAAPAAALASSAAHHANTAAAHHASKHNKKKPKKKKRHHHKKKHNGGGAGKAIPIDTGSGPAPATTTPPSSTTPAASGAPTGSAPSPVTPALVTHLLAQQGLLVGMASNVLQNQVYLDIGDTDTPGSCNALDGGGSTKLTSATHPSATEVDETRVLYYDAACAKPYISSTAKVIGTATGSQVTATAVYTSPSAATLGSLVTSATTVDGTSDIKLAGLGTWTGAGGGPVVSLGLTCDAPATSSSVVPPFPCEGGVVQDFPSLGRALGSLTPLTMTIDTGGAGPALAFTSSGTGSTMEIGTLGSLALTLDPSGALAITGSPIATLGDTLTGQAGAFSLFPPTPTTWSSSDPADGQSFTIAVTDNATRNLTGAVTAAGAGATFALDQSGTGTITYAGGATVAVSSWILSG